MCAKEFLERHLQYAVLVKVVCQKWNEVLEWRERVEEYAEIKQKMNVEC